MTSTPRQAPRALDVARVFQELASVMLALADGVHSMDERDLRRVLHYLGRASEGLQPLGLLGRQLLLDRAWIVDLYDGTRVHNATALVPLQGRQIPGIVAALLRSEPTAPPRRREDFWKLAKLMLEARDTAGIERVHLLAFDLGCVVVSGPRGLAL